MNTCPRTFFYQKETQVELGQGSNTELENMFAS